MPSREPEDELKSFISVDPEAQYSFDSEQNSSQSELCRGAGMNEKECLKLQMNSKRLFEAMQKQGFYCALPMEPGRTYMDCKPMPGR